jgi:hypothetical protein
VFFFFFFISPIEKTELFPRWVVELLNEDGISAVPSWARGRVSSGLISHHFTLLSVSLVT